MPYLAIDSFSAGMDRRRKRVAGVPGSLWTLKDAHITRGGDIERRKRFVSAYALPSGSFSLAGIRSQLYTFGSADLAATTPLGVTYQRLLASASSVLAIASGQNAANAETLVIDAKTYTFQTVLTNVDGNIKIGASRTATLTNLSRAINASGGTPGTDYATANTIHPTVFAVDRLDGTMLAMAKTAGSGGNSIVVTEALAQGTWTPNANLGGGAAGLSKIIDAKPYQGKMYVIAEYDDGNLYHFLDGTRVNDWDNVVTPTAEDVASSLAAKLSRSSVVRAKAFGATVEITARTPGTAFTISGSATDGSGGDTTETLTVTQLQANVAGVVEVLATAAFTITGGTNDPGTDTINSVTVNGVEILAAAVDWSGSNAATAIRVAAEINNGTALHGYTASVIAAAITLSAAPGTGTTPNGYVLTVTKTGTVTVTADAALAGGVDAVAAVAQVEKAVITGLIEKPDTFLVTITAVDYKVTGLAAGMGTSVYVDKQRLWSTAGRLWRYSMLGRADIWDPANTTASNDSGFIDLMEVTEVTDAALAATRYQNLAAVFSQNFIALYSLDVNPTLVAVADTLDNTGTDAPKSIVRYGNNDVFYLDATGIRSLRARDASNSPFVSDVGNAVDTFVQETLATLTQAQAVDAVAAIEPRDGRYWLAAGGYIFVLSFFPADKISAWSYYQPEEFGANSVSALVRIAKQMYVRAGNTVFLYGGVNNDEYPIEDESPVEVEFPFLSAGALASFKEWIGFDLACTNEWEIVVLYDPNNESRTVELGRLTKTTFNEMNTGLSGLTSMVAPKLTCRRAGAATISSMALHYNKVD